MRKIILIILVIALFYAYQLFSQEPTESPSAVQATQSEQEQTTYASFTGGFLILVAVGTGYVVKKAVYHPYYCRLIPYQY